MAHRMHQFQDRVALAEALADRVAALLSAAIAARGAASLAVSGGSTPKLFFEALSTRDIAWDRVTVTLVDERFVPADHPRSNHLLVATHLLKDKAAPARFVPLYHAAANAEDAAALATDETASLGKPFDVVILGMGNDGHTASFFPGGDRLADAMDPATTATVLPMRAPGAGEPRITLTLPVLRDAGRLYLHIEGGEKRQVLQQALSGQGAGAGYPVRAVLQALRAPLQVYLTQ